METEVFTLKETENLLLGDVALEEWKQKVKELGLDGQQSLVDPSKEDNSPVPFLWMNEQMKAVFEILCPTKVKVQEYDKLPIPLEILGAVYLCQQNNYFPEMYVWYDDEKPDPIVTGTRDKKTYLIGRWGAERMNFDRLREEAKKRFITRGTESLKNKIMRLQTNLTNIASLAEQKLRGGYVWLED